jgi:hypothetical protein
VLFYQGESGDGGGEAVARLENEVSKRDHQLERLREHLLETENAHTADALAREEVCMAQLITNVW